MALSLHAGELARPQPNFFFLEVLADLWHPESNPRGYVNLGLAENCLMHGQLLSRMHMMLKEPGAIPDLALTYGDGYKRLRQAVSRFLTRQLHPFFPIEPSHVLPGNGCTVAIENMAWALANPGEGILVGRPYYGAFPTDIGKRTGVKFVPVSFGDDDAMGMAAVQRYEDAICAARDGGGRIGAIMLAHPHNPLGRCYPRDVLVAYMRLCEKHQVHLVSDEIYALSVFDNTIDGDADASAPFTSVLSIDPAGIIDRSLVHVLWGMSKDFGANGLRMGFVVTQANTKLQAALGSVFEFSWTSALSDLVTVRILEDDDWVESYLAENRRRLAAHHERVIRWAREHEIPYAAGTNAGFFVWVNLGSAYRRHRPGRSVADVDETVMKALLERRVFLADGVRFGAEQAGWFRIIFTQEADILDEGLRRILAVVKGDTDRR
ncbi:aminotransferase [Drechmeria coniospora]|uniref:Aminotransferase n=1 Tax=Drechmeria coniospora TaxID=98403 RepID=A0A151GG47_DRECN|nr:aminotransferase [Drechmeria coniospora]KYK56070.1 aminotransferase [Drechmeria coniospora]